MYVYLILSNIGNKPLFQWRRRIRQPRCLVELVLVLGSSSTRHPCSRITDASFNPHFPASCTHSALPTTISRRDAGFSHHFPASRTIPAVITDLQSYSSHDHDLSLSSFVTTRNAS